MKSDATTRICWCGNAELVDFGGGYRACSSCATLVTLDPVGSDPGRVQDDDHDFYGKSYWLQHQTGALHTPDIFQRSRSDLTERNLHWLHALLRLRRPPARVLDLGCSHGGFVALLQQSGFDACGMEISPWVVDYARRTFAIPVILGPIEDADPPAQLFDVIVMTDVLEHLSDPVGTLRACARWLAPDGLLLIQTPSFDANRHYAEMVEGQLPFLEMMMPDEHLYLFSRASVRQLLATEGFGQIEELPAIFERYDMFLAASRVPMQPASAEDIERALLATPGGRMAMAMLELRGRELAALGRAAAFEADSSARLGQVETLTGLLKESEADRAARGEQITVLTAQLKRKESWW